MLLKIENVSTGHYIIADQKSPEEKQGKKQK